MSAMSSNHLLKNSNNSKITINPKQIMKKLKIRITIPIPIKALMPIMLSKLSNQTMVAIELDTTLSSSIFH